MDKHRKREISGTIPELPGIFPIVSVHGFRKTLGLSSRQEKMRTEPHRVEYSNDGTSVVTSAFGGIIGLPECKQSELADVLKSAKRL
jgi:hypothetical protein